MPKFNITSEQIAKEHDLSQEDSQALQKLIVNHLARLSASILISIEDREDRELQKDIAQHEEEWDVLIKSVSPAVLSAMEDYLYKQLGA